MSKPVKEMTSQYLRDRYQGVNSACVVDLTGLDVAAQQKIRDGLRDKKARMQVVKNGLARRAFADTALRPLSEVLTGPCALVTGGDSAVEVARLLVGLTKEIKGLKLKQAIYDGDAALLTVDELSRMKGRLELLGEVAALIGGPGRRLAGAIAGAQGRVAGCIKTLADREEPAGPEVGGAAPAEGGAAEGQG